MILDSLEEQSQIELTLSPEASEWLFYVNFWDGINGKHQTDFAQYEEESLSADIVEETSNSLASMKASLINDDGQVISFRYAWNQNKEELICRVNSQLIADEIERKRYIQFISSISKAQNYRWLRFGVRLLETLRIGWAGAARSSLAEPAH
ncbi:MAG TPA: hypothetical protein VGC21_02790 [Telluria sp.]|jgi:hypothetical protein